MTLAQGRMNGTLAEIEHEADCPLLRQNPRFRSVFLKNIGANVMSTVVAASIRKTSPLNPYRIETKSQGGFEQ
jgi:hypothetical protein